MGVVNIYTIILFILFTCSIAHLSVGTNAYYTVCKKNLVSCGNVQNVGYPFSGGDRPDFCGHPNFHLSSCENGPTVDPLINQVGNTNGQEALSARVVSINTSSHTMVLAQDSPFGDHNTHISCQSLIRNKSIINLPHPFNFTPSDAIISLFSNCSHSLANHTASYKNVTCNNGTSPMNWAYYADKQADKERIGKLCSTRRVFQVLQSELDELNKGNWSLSRVLNSGFEVEYTVDFKGCLDCRNSGGECGSSENDETQFVCYCPEGKPTSRVCHKTGITTQSKFAIIGSVSGLMILALVSLITCSKKQPLLLNKFPILEIRGTKENRNVEAFLKAYGSLAPKRYRYADIKKIANSFKEKLGEGGFGSVYNGKLQDGRLVAVKLLNKMKGDGDDFLNEVLSISRTNHVNVVTLLGFCLEGNKRALVYEYLANGSLDKFICSRNTRPSLQWETLFKIAVGIARGLNYLHTGCNARILHFDIKPHNVLLDEDFCPKISDFGLAKLCPRKDGTISMLEARGTIGYIAPEVVYRNIGGVSHKSDVYSYGMMVLDMACGRQNSIPEAQLRSSEVYFPEWIFKQLEQREVAIPETLNEEDKAVQRKMILVSLLCIQKYPSDRPSMNKVVEMIEGPLESLPEPSRATMVYF